ncbi:hypothetical protein HHK36_005011 [Tetracentron sinense]|uniref:Glycosyl transferase 48 domain-containing protein n=1 Tax=Tetracentron sinense TaxID=13715 RepID=A0A834ZKU0_TETSI|nr:hypothetical protein HHK36_005011 [Tetracentron sinense]
MSLKTGRRTPSRVPKAIRLPARRGDMLDRPSSKVSQAVNVPTSFRTEDVLYTEEELKKENEDGISILSYLQKIYPDEWSNFQERMKDPDTENAAKELMELVRQWVSYRGQTLFRTVRGMMYYKQALELQCFLDMAEDHERFDGYRAIDLNYHDRTATAFSRAVTDMKFTYVVSCQIYGAMKKANEGRNRTCYQNILNLMLTHSSLRVAYIDEREETVKGKSEKVYYSVLVKGGYKLDEGEQLVVHSASCCSTTDMLASTDSIWSIL